jgi:hypothetical protein
MSMAHQPLAAIIARLAGIPAEQGRDFGFDSLRQERSRTVAQHLSQRIDKTAWLGKLKNVSLVTASAPSSRMASRQSKGCLKRGVSQAPQLDC